MTLTRTMRPKTVAVLAIIVVVLSLFYWPTFRWLVNSWLTSDYYSHGFLVPVISGFFVWTQREHLRRREPSIAIGAPVLTLGIGLYVLSFLWEARVLGAISLLIVLAALALLVFGTRATRAMPFPLGFLAFMVPPPFIQDLGYGLQETSIRSSSWLLEVMGFPITSSGPEIHLGGVTFTIGLICSGTNTLVALLALAAVYVHLLTGSGYRRAGLLALAIPIAAGANILRITSIIAVAHFVNIETATGWYHDLSSPLFFAIAFLTLVLFGRIMKLRLNYGVARQR